MIPLVEERSISPSTMFDSDSSARDAEHQEAFVHHFDTPGRVVKEIVPTARIACDSETMSNCSRSENSIRNLYFGILEHVR